MKAKRRLKELLNGQDINNLSSITKREIVIDLLLHVDETSVENPTYGVKNFRSDILKLIATYEKAVDSESYVELAKEMDELADRVLKEAAL